MSYQAWITIILVILLLIALIKNLAPPDLLFFGATTLLTLLGTITPAEAFAGFANSGMLTIAVLFVVAARKFKTSSTLYSGPGSSKTWLLY